MKAIDVTTGDTGEAYATDHEGDNVPLFTSFGDKIVGPMELNANYACCMIPIPAGYRLATEEDKKLVKPVGYMFTDSLVSGWKDGECPRKFDWVTNRLYAIPIQTKAETKKAELQKKADALLAQAKEIQAEIAKL